MADKPEKAPKTPTPEDLVKCPNCGTIMHLSEVQPYAPEPFPCMLYKANGDTKVVDDQAALDKALADGWTTEPPPPPDAKKAEHAPLTPTGKHLLEQEEHNKKK